VDREVMDDRLVRRFFGGFGLWQHTRERCNASATRALLQIDEAGARDLCRRSHARGAAMQQDGGGGNRKSGGARRATAATAPRVELSRARQRPLALLAAVVADRGVVRAAGARGGLLGVAGATVPDTFPERHRRSFDVESPVYPFERWSRYCAIDVPRTPRVKDRGLHGRPADARGTLLPRLETHAP
jgi:hypothetical protein